MTPSGRRSRRCGLAQDARSQRRTSNRNGETSPFHSVSELTRFHHFIFSSYRIRTAFALKLIRNSSEDPLYCGPLDGARTSGWIFLSLRSCDPLSTHLTTPGLKTADEERCWTPPYSFNSRICISAPFLSLFMLHSSCAQLPRYRFLREVSETHLGKEAGGTHNSSG